MHAVFRRCFCLYSEYWIGFSQKYLTYLCNRFVTLRSLSLFLVEPEPADGAQRGANGSKYSRQLHFELKEVYFVFVRLSCKRVEVVRSFLFLLLFGGLLAKTSSCCLCAYWLRVLLFAFFYLQYFLQGDCASLQRPDDDRTVSRRDRWELRHLHPNGRAGVRFRAKNH